MEAQKKETSSRQREKPQPLKHDESISEKKPIVNPDADTWLADMRRAKNLRVRDVLPVIQVRFPKCEGSLYSRVERPKDYGVKFIPSLEKVIQQAFDYKPLRGRRSDNRTFPCRVSFRLSNDEFSGLQMAISADGYETLQAWGRDMALRYVRETGATK